MADNQLVCSGCLENYSSVEAQWQQESSRGDEEEDRGGATAQPVLFRMLPCGSTSCHSCIHKMIDDKKVLKYKCNSDSCSQEHVVPDYRELPPAELPDTKPVGVDRDDDDCATTTTTAAQSADGTLYDEADNSRPDDSFLCDLCRKLGRSTEAICYCTEHSCKKKYCNKHRTNHDENHPGEHHQSLSRKEYNQNPHLHPTERVCNLVGHDTSLACEKCFTLSCAICLPTQTQCQGGTTHQWQPSEVINEIIQKRFKDLKSVATEKISEYKRRIYSTQDDHDEQRDKQQEMKKVLHDRVTTQMREIEERSRQMKAEIEVHHNENAEIHCSYSEEISDRIDNLEQLMESVNSLNSRPVEDKLRGYHDIAENITQATQQELRCCEWKAPLALAQKGSYRNLELEAVKVPTSIEYQRDYKVDSCCYAVRFNDDGGLWIGQDKGISSRRPGCWDDRSEHQETNLATACTAVIPQNNIIFYTEEPHSGNRDKGKVKVSVITGPVHSPTELFEYDIDPCNPVDMAVSSDYVALMDKKAEKVIVFDRKKREKRFHEFTSCHNGLCFHMDGDLIVTNQTNGTVSKHTIKSVNEMVESEEGWVCRDLDGPGLIYVRSSNKQAIYVVSEGKIQATLEDGQIPTSRGSISVQEDQLVVACGHDKVFKSFKIKH